MENIELKPCPFCGHEVHLRELKADGSLNKGTYIYKIHCPRIYSNDYCLGSSINEWFNDKEECIKLWNQRV